MKDIYIVCAGGFGQEVYVILKTINKKAVSEGKEAPYNIKGFLNDISVNFDRSYIGIDIVGDIQNWEPKGNEVYALGLSDPKGKEKIAALLKSKGAKFETIIAPWSIIPDNISIGEGCIISPYLIMPGVKIGNFVNIMGSVVGSQAEIGDYSTITGFANVTNAKIGKRVFVGSHAVIMNQRKIGDDAFICVGSVVFNNVKQGQKVFGIPAKKVDWE